VLWLRDDLTSAVLLIFDEIVSSLWISPFAICKPKSIEAGYRSVRCDKNIIFAHITNNPLTKHKDQSVAENFEKESIEWMM
jgi:hypothetical protein